MPDDTSSFNAFSRHDPTGSSCGHPANDAGCDAAWHRPGRHSRSATSGSSYMRGRVMGLFNIAWQLFPLGFMLGGVLAAWLGNEVALISGGLALIVANGVLSATSRQLREAG